MTNAKSKNNLASRYVGANLGFGLLTENDVNYHLAWKPASGHPGGWRVVRGIGPTEELCDKDGKLILLETLAVAALQADTMNAAEL